MHLFCFSCAGPQTYREHLEGQKHKKREAATKMAASVAVTSQNRAGNSLRCQLCDVTCTGNSRKFCLVYKKWRHRLSEGKYL